MEGVGYLAGVIILALLVAGIAQRLLKGARVPLPGPVPFLVTLAIVIGVLLFAYGDCNKPQIEEGQLAEEASQGAMLGGKSV